jgi:hypothetical protein
MKGVEAVLNYMLKAKDMKSVENALEHRQHPSLLQELTRKRKY